MEVETERLTRTVDFIIALSGGTHRGLPDGLDLELSNNLIFRWAVKSGDIALCKELLKVMKNKDLMAASEIAVSLGYLEVLHLLEGAGQRLKPVFLSIAISNNQLDMVRYLHEMGMRITSEHLQESPSHEMSQYLARNITAKRMSFQEILVIGVILSAVYLLRRF